MIFTCLWNKLIQVQMFSYGTKCYHLELMLSCGMKFYHLGYIFSSGAKFIMWSKCYVKAFVIMWYEVRNVIILDQMLSSGSYVIMWDEMLLCGMKWYHLGWNVIIWDEMLSSGANVIMCNKSSLVEEDVVIWSILWCKVPKKLILSSGVVMWCYHVGWHPLFYYSWKLQSFKNTSFF